MKITKLTTFLVPPRWCFLRIDTDAGISGWGEPVVEGRAHTVAAAVDELSDYLIGKDPRHIEDLWNVMYRGSFYRGGPILSSALAGLGMAVAQRGAYEESVEIFQRVHGSEAEARCEVAFVMKHGKVYKHAPFATGSLH